MTSSQGRPDEMERCIYSATSRIEEAELRRDWRIMDELRGLRTLFSEMVEDAFEEFRSEVDRSGKRDTAASEARRMFQEKCTEFKRRVRQTL